MRTTLVIDDDVLTTAKAMAEQQNTSIGVVISSLARRALHRPQPRGERNGVPLLAPVSGTTPVTLETVNALRDEAP